VKIFAVVRETLEGPFSAVHYPFPRPFLNSWAQHRLSPVFLWHSHRYCLLMSVGFFITCIRREKLMQRLM